MSLNCPHAWEEYKKLDTAHDALRREYLALRGEQSNDNSNEFKNVHKEWLVKMRELRWRCLEHKKKFWKNLELKMAEEIMGEQFYGPEEIKNAFGFEISKDKIPAIPYSPAELEEAEKLGERLVLRIKEDSKGNPMTMEHINKLAQARMAKDEGKLLNSIDWYKDEEFFKKQSLRTEWKLVGGNLLEGSTGKTYADQTKVLRDYLKGIGELSPTEELECSDDNLAKIANDANKLARLEINQKHRRSLGEVSYDWFLHFKKFKDRDYLEGNRDWTNVVSYGGDLVILGYVDSVGAYVCWYDPADRYDDLGVVSVR